MLGGNPEFLAKNELRKLDLPEELLSEADSHAETQNPEILEIRAKYRQLLEQFKTQIADEAKRVRAAGGLFIIGTERHESRRIDNQLRGRSGRQGDPGESRFYLSLQDDLMRLFSSDRIMTMMDTMGLDEDTPIDAKILSGAVENAQKSVESQHFRSRKNVLEYDNVMNTQREVIYAQRQKVLDGEDLQENMMSMLRGVISSTVADCLGQTGGVLNEDGGKELLARLGGIYFAKDTQLPENGADSETVTEELYEKAVATYQAKEAQYGSAMMRELKKLREEGIVEVDGRKVTLLEPAC
jgi:preprotein translocase subunit SecA